MTDTDRIILNQALGYIRGRETTARLGATTLEQSIATELLLLDSDQTGLEGLAAFRPEAEDPTELTESPLVGIGQGRLQRIRTLRTALLGDDGAITRLKRGT
jgi:hypothetical protein